MIKVRFINNDGGGWPQDLEIEEGTTIERFLQDHIEDFEPNNYKIRVNREAVTADQILTDGVRISATPVKISGAK